MPGISNLFNQSIQEKFIRLVEVAKGRIEFHIVSYSGYNRGKQTFEDAINLVVDLRILEAEGCHSDQ